MILWYTLRCLRFSCSLKKSWLIISAIDYVNDIRSFMIYFHRYCIPERPVRSIIIINIIVIVVAIINYYRYRIIIISHPPYLCVVWLVSITQQRKCWYSWLYSLAGTIKTNQNYRNSSVTSSVQFLHYRCTTAIKLNWLWCLCLYGRFCLFIAFAMNIIEWKVIHYAIPSKQIWTFKYYPPKQFSYITTVTD